ncbi:MAG: HEAT repeat domain-containing protein [Planctomycetes bacterium]|nr:HEAT repeat domain-containing protein [Planctomycetota bacterium]
MGATRTKLLVIGLLVLVAALVATVAYVGQISHAPTNNSQPAGANQWIPDLGGRGKPMPGSNDAAPAANATPDPASNNAPDNTQPEPPPDRESSVFEIDTYLTNLAHGVRTRNQRTIDLAQAALSKCRPDKLVDERVQAALSSQPDAFVRTGFFAAFHQPQASLAWAQQALELRSGKFLGTDAVYDPGEEAELGTYASLLLKQLIQGLRQQPPATPDARCLAFTRNVLDTERPPWALRLLLQGLAEDVLAPDVPEFPRLLEQELKHLLERASADWQLREIAFLLYALAHQDLSALVASMETPFLRPHVATLLSLMPQRRPPPLQQELTFPLMDSLRALAPAVSDLVARVLAGNAPQAEKQLLIQRLAARNLPRSYDILQAGLQRKDANYGDYLAAWGYSARTAQDLARLVEAAASADSASATGAIEGLRQSQLPEADTELKRLVEQGDNAGVQSQALGALLLRNATEAEKLVESYLGADRDPALRAVAVAHIEARNTSRMQKVIEEDASPRVRQAALTRLGDLKDKKLRSFFLGVAISDPSPLLRSQAKKYAEELKDE